jgi:hypothetical protein
MGLELASSTWYHSQFKRMRVPYTGIWSPTSVPKPPDWGDHLNVAGYIVDEVPDYAPGESLGNFLEADDRAPK